MRFYSIAQSLCRPAAFAASLMLLAMMVAVTADVVTDLVVGRPITNVIEIVSVYLMVAIVFLPLGQVELRNDHIGADILADRLPRRIRTGLYVAVTLVSVAFVLVLFYQSLIDALKAMDRREMIMGTRLLYVWPSRFSLPIGFFLFAVALVANMVKTVFGPPDEAGDKTPDAATPSGQKAG